MQKSGIELKKEKIKYLLRNDRQFFFEYILEHYIKTHNVGELHTEWFELLESKEKLGIIAPREHAKSTTINLADNLFDICNHGISVNQPYILMFSDTLPQAKAHLGNIVAELEENEKIHAWYGKLYKKRKVGETLKEKWTEDTIITTNNVKVTAMGWRFRARGLRRKEERPSKIVMDDIENDEDVASDKMRKKLKSVFQNKILNLGSRKTKYRFVGTVLHFDSLLFNEYKKPRKGWKWKMYQAIANNQPVWPEWWPMERLDIRKAEVGSISFEQEFMNNPLNPEDQIIKPVEFYDRIDTDQTDNYGFIDLAISEKETGDYTAICTIARDRGTGALYVVDPVRMRGSITEQMDLVFEQHKKYRYKAFGVETVAYQKAFAQLLAAESAKRGSYVPTIECVPDKDKVRRAIDIVPHIENGTILFNNGYQDFMSELVQFPKAAHDDWVDAFVGAVKLALTGGSSGKIYTKKGINYPKGA